MACCGKVGDAISNEHYEGNGAIGGSESGAGAELGYGAGFVVAELTVVEPDGAPLRSRRIDLGVVGDNLDVGGLNNEGVVR